MAGDSPLKRGDSPLAWVNRLAGMTDSLDSMQKETRVFPPPAAFAQRAHIPSMEAYSALCAEADADPDAYWGARGREELFWKVPFQTVLEWKPPHARWYVEGRTNLAYNCLDRHLAERGGKTALL